MHDQTIPHSVQDPQIAKPLSEPFKFSSAAEKQFCIFPRFALPALTPPFLKEKTRTVSVIMQLACRSTCANLFRHKLLLARLFCYQFKNSTMETFRFHFITYMNSRKIGHFLCFDWSTVYWSSLVDIFLLTLPQSISVPQNIKKLN